jgi:hypothetical protein
MGLKGKRFTTMENIKPNVMTKIQKIPKEVIFQCSHLLEQV